MNSDNREARVGRQIGVRIDDDLYKALERDAKENGRTVTQTVRYLLGKTLLDATTA